MKTSRQLLLFILFLFSSTLVLSQVQKGVTISSIGLIDSAYGINKYERLNFFLGGDSVRYDKKGYSVQGWWEDYYENGNVLHKGYYVDGQLRNYKNFYINGHLERSYRQTNIGKSEMEIYYDTDTLKSMVWYVGENAQKWIDFFPNGKIFFIEEYDKRVEKLIQRKVFNETGMPQLLIQISDEKKQLYIQQEYYENGKLKEGGKIIMSDLYGDFQKEGKWNYYDENGKWIREEIYNKGQMISGKNSE